MPAKLSGASEIDGLNVVHPKVNFDLLTRLERR